MIWAIVLLTLALAFMSFVAYGLWRTIQARGAPSQEYLDRDAERRSALDREIRESSEAIKKRADTTPTQKDWDELRARMKAVTDDCEGC